MFHAVDCDLGVQSVATTRPSTIFRTLWSRLIRKLMGSLLVVVANSARRQKKHHTDANYGATAIEVDYTFRGRSLNAAVSQQLDSIELFIGCLMQFL